jgi:hypothetical protein
MKRIITRVAFCIMCVLSVFISCSHDEDDDEPNWAYHSPWRVEQNKEYEVRLSSEMLPIFHDAFLINPASSEIRLNDFVAGMW